MCGEDQKNVDFFFYLFFFNALLDFWEWHIPVMERSLLEPHKAPCAHPIFPTKFHAKRRR